MRIACRRFVGLVALCLGAVSATATDAAAGVTYYSSASSFHAVGSISSTANFDSYSADSVVGYGTRIGDIIVNTNTYGVVLGPTGSYYKPIRNIVVQPNFANVVVDVASGPPTFNMLGVKYGTMFGGAVVSLYVVTNFGGYNFNVPGSYAGSALAFAGFVATGPGEHITQIQAYSYAGSGGGAGLTDFELGTTAPEPTTLASAVIGAVGLARMLRARRRRTARA